MRSSNIKWVGGSAAFSLPTITVFVTNRVLRESHPAAFWTALVLAAVIPPALVLSSKRKWRIAFAFGLLVLLAVQFCLILICLLAGFRE
jgi:hypothetical protein